jgi:predicted enzyme related to lactoylglutathione lyase
MVSFAIPGPPYSPEMAAAINRALDEGSMHGLGMNVDDCRKTCEELRAKGVEFVQEPEDRPYGVEAVARDNSGNWMVLVEPRAYTASDFDS